MTNKTDDGADLSILAAELREYVRQYRAAEELMEENGDLLLPRSQMRGQLLELALKSYAAEFDNELWGHDLVALAEETRELGLVLTEKESGEFIPELNKRYYFHEGRGHKFLTRYPDPNPTLGAWILPDRTPYREMIDSIVTQTKAAMKNQ